MATAASDILLQHLHKVVVQGTANLPDEELLERFAAQRDETAFAGLVYRHGPMVLRVCWRVLRNWHDAEDAFQATFLVLSRKAASVRRQGSVSSWLYGVAHRLSLHSRAAAARRRAHEGRAPERPSGNPLDELTVREAQTILDEELARLPEKYRAPLVLCCLEGRDRDDAAQQLGWSAGILKSRLEQGRERLRLRLTRRGLTLPAALATCFLIEGAAPAAVPATLARATVQAAEAFSEGVTTAGVVSAHIAALAEAWIRAMFVAKVKIAAVLLLAVGLVAASAGMVVHQALAQNAAQEERTGESKGTTERPDKTKTKGPKQVHSDRYGDPLPPGAIARVGSTRLWHGSHTYGLLYAPDGRTLAACSESIIRLWDTATGKEIRQFQGQKPWISSLAFSADGKLLASAGRGDLMIWRLDAASTQAIRRLAAGKDVAYSLAFSPDAKFLAAATMDQIIHVWQTDTWREVRQLVGHEGRFSLDSLAFFPDGKTLVSAGGDDGTIRLWDVAAGKQLRLFAEKVNGVWSMALSPDGKTLACVQARKTLRLWNTATSKEISCFTGPENSLYCIGFSPDSRTLASAGGINREVRFWDAATGKERHRWGWTSLDTASRLAFAPDGNVLAVGGGGRICFRKVATGKDVLPLPGPPDLVRTVGFTPNGKTVFVATWDGTVGLWDATTGKEASPVQSPPQGYVPLSPFHSNYLLSPALSRDGGTVASIDAQRAVWVWEAAKGKMISQFGGPHSVLPIVALSADGKMAAVADPNKKVGLWDVTTGRLIRRLDPQPEPVNKVIFSPDGTVLAVTYSNSTIGLWETATGKEVGLLRWPGSIAQCLAFSSDGKVVASGHSGYVEMPPQGKEEETLVRIWDVGTGREIRQLKGPASRTIDSVAFSPDGRTLAAGTYSLIYLWEVAGGNERGRFEGHGGDVMGVAFSPDGRLLASGSSDRTALVWDVTGLFREGEPRAADSSFPQLQSLWTDLSSTDAPRAYQAIWKLIRAGKQTVPFLKDRLRPISADDCLRLVQLLAELDSERFAVRKRATAELTRLGVLAEPALIEKLTSKSSLEVRQRVESLLGKLREGSGNAEALRVLRSIEVLEHIGTPEARQLLAALAEGAPDARLTKEAKVSLERLAKRSAAGGAGERRASDP